MTSTTSFLDADGLFTKGQFKGESLEDVADEEPSYIEYLLENDDLSSEDRDAFKEALSIYDEEEDIDLDTLDWSDRE